MVLGNRKPSWNCSRIGATSHYKKYDSENLSVLRDIVSWKLVKSEDFSLGNIFYFEIRQFLDDIFFIGGHGHLIQIDESVISKTKYNRGRLIRERWVIVIYNTTFKKGYIPYINNRTAESFESVILAHVRPGSEIWTDKWKGHNNLKNFG